MQWDQSNGVVLRHLSQDLNQQWGDKLWELEVGAVIQTNGDGSFCRTRKFSACGCSELGIGFVWHHRSARWLKQIGHMACLGGGWPCDIALLCHKRNSRNIRNNFPF